MSQRTISSVFFFFFFNGPVASFFSCIALIELNNDYFKFSVC